MLILRITLTLSFIIFSGCALLGSGGTNNELVRAGDYAVSAPPSWKATAKDESDQAFRMPSGNVVTVTSSCKKNAEAPLEVLTRHLLFGGRKVEIVERKTLTVDGVPGLFSRVRATFDGVRAFLVLFVLSKNGCVFDFSLVSNRMIPDSDIDDFLNFVKSFEYGKH